MLSNVVNTNQNKSMNRKRAFTLIELMVVILILGILAALILPKVVGRTSDAKIGAAKRDLATLSSAISQFRVDCDRYPTTEEGLNALQVPPNGVNGFKGPYLTKGVPADPWGGEYIYQYPGTNGQESFTLESYGSDHAPGGEGDAADIIDGTE